LRSIGSRESLKEISLMIVEKEEARVDDELIWIPKSYGKVGPESAKAGLSTEYKAVT
jgi:hypothetical protein